MEIIRDTLYEIDRVYGNNFVHWICRITKETDLTKDTVSIFLRYSIHILQIM